MGREGAPFAAKSAPGVDIEGVTCGGGHRDPSAGFSTETGCWSTTLRATTVPDTFVTVTFHQCPDGVGAAEVLGQHGQAGSGTSTHRPALGSTRFQRPGFPGPRRR